MAQDWLSIVLEATAPEPRELRCWGIPRNGRDLPARRFHGGMFGDRVATPRLVKLVVSATMTRDPSKLEQLQLHSPCLLSATPSDERYAVTNDALQEPHLIRILHRYQFPPKLEHFRIVVPSNQKPHALIALLHSMLGSSVLVFTASVRAVVVSPWSYSRRAHAQC